MKRKTRNLIFGSISVLGGILIHFAFGFFYSTANMVPYIMGYIITRVDPNLSPGASIWLSAVALAMQGVSMPFGGLIARKWGFRIVVATSCLLDSISIFLTYVTIQKSFPGVVITYSVLQGLGLGFGYSVVLAVAATWFPKRRGLVVGLIVGGFGLGAVVFTPIETAIINPGNIPVDSVTRNFNHPDVLDRIPVAFLILGGIVLALQIVGFILLRPKPKRNTHNQDTELVIRNRMNSDPNAVIREYTQEEPKLDVCVPPKQLFRHIDFYLLWFIMFCDIIPITIITSAYKQFGNQYISDDRFLSIVATISSIFNAGGRVVWGALVDRFSFKHSKLGPFISGIVMIYVYNLTSTYWLLPQVMSNILYFYLKIWKSIAFFFNAFQVPMMTMLVIWAIVLFSFPHIGSVTGVGLKVFYAIWVFILYFSLSGVFAIQPAATGILFGSLHMAVNYGFIFSAFNVMI
ncbi:oxalate:formate antiporter isoform 3 [Schistosoma japonicum]|uniref:Oxalate:formate antiporter isoform 3 n=1 Tax=Schistosoma japonicum TaxID=6182 RepID=A0A4Z2DWN4_SCHJA|nr:oxalate:formate antiporter isoform 3 [Schistosoma japonicum]